jgi:transposase
MIRGTTLWLAVWALIAVLGASSAPPDAYANKVDCSKVMAEVAAGKKAKEIAGDLKISTSSVYRCKKKAAAAKSRPGMTPTPSPTPKK